MIIKGEVRGINDFVLGYLDPKDNTIKSFLEIMRDVDLAMTLPNVFVSSREGFSVPYLMSTGGKDLTKVFALFSRRTEVLPEETLEKIVALTNALNVDFYRRLNEIYLQAIDYLEGNVKAKIDLPITKFDGTDLTRNLVAQLNDKSNISLSIKDNNTKFREDENSELFITIPNPDALTFSDPSDFIPKMFDVFKPYRHKELNTMAYKNYIGAEGTTLEMVDGSPDNITEELYPEEKRYYDALCSLHQILLDMQYPGKLDDCEKMKMSSKHFREYIEELVLKVLTYHWNQHGMLPIGIAADSDDDDDESESAGSASGEMMSNRMFDPNVTFTPYGDEVIKAVINEQFLKDIYYPINILIQCLRFGKKKPTRLKVIADNSNGNVKYRYFDLTTFQYVNSSGSLGSYEVQETPSGCTYNAVAFVEMNTRIADQKFVRENDIKVPLIKLPVGLLCQKRFKGTDEVQNVLISFVDILGNRGKDKSLTIEGLIVNGNQIEFTDTFPKEVLNISSSKKASLIDVLNAINNSNDGLFIPYVNDSIRDVYMEFTAFSKKLSSLGIAEEFIQKHDLAKLVTFSCFNLEELKLKCQQYALPPTNLLAMTIGINESRLIANVNDAYTQLQNEDPYCNLKSLLEKFKENMDLLEYHGAVFYEEEVVESESSMISSTTAQSSPNGMTNQVANNQVAQSSVFNTGHATVTQSTQTQASVQEQANVQPQQVTQPAHPPVDTFQAYLDKHLFENREFSREQIIAVVMTTEEIAKVNGVYQKLNNPFRVKDFGTFSEGLTIVGYLVMTPDKKYFLLDPVQREYAVNKPFHLNKFGQTMIRLLNIVVNQKPSPLKFTSREAFNYYSMISERM